MTIEDKCCFFILKLKNTCHNKFWNYIQLTSLKCITDKCTIRLGTQKLDGPIWMKDISTEDNFRYVYIAYVPNSVMCIAKHRDPLWIALDRSKPLNCIGRLEHPGHLGSLPWTANDSHSWQHNIVTGQH